MKQRNNAYLMTFLFIAALASTLLPQNYSVPSPLSPYDLAIWANRGGFIASGSAIPTEPAQIGALYVNDDDPDEPKMYRYGAAGWSLVAGGGGVSTHSQLLGLDFATSGHTGFASESAINEHIADQIDPHGATMTVSQEITIGDPEASATVFLDNPASGVARIAGKLIITDELTPASGTIEPYAKFHRVATMTLADPDTWTDVEWDTVPAGETGFGFKLVSSTTIMIASSSMVQIAGCLHPRWTGKPGTSVTIASRVVYSHDNGSTWTEARCSQQVASRSNQSNEVDTPRYGGTVAAKNGTKLKLQTRVSDVGMVFAGWNVFDSPISATINLFTTGN